MVFRSRVLAAGGTSFGLAPVAAPAGVSIALVFAFFFLGLAVASLDAAVLPSGAAGIADDICRTGIRPVYLVACSRVLAHFVRDVFSSCPPLGWEN
jgi:hypothetical protein